MDAKIFVSNDDHIVDEMRAIISFTKRTHSSSNKGYGVTWLLPTVRGSTPPSEPKI